MSVAEEKQQEPKPIARTNSDRIIIFYATTQVVRTAKREDFREKVANDEPRDTAPKLGKWVNVYEYNRGEKNRGLVLTTLNLSKLGWADSCRRMFGRCNEIYVDYGHSDDY